MAGVFLSQTAVETDFFYKEVVTQE